MVNKFWQYKVRVSVKGYVTNQIYFKLDDFQTTSSTNENKDKVTKGSDKEGLLTFKGCRYSFKKQISLKKHMVTKH